MINLVEVVNAKVMDNKAMNDKEDYLSVEEEDPEEFDDDFQKPSEQSMKARFVDHFDKMFPVVPESDAFEILLEIWGQETRKKRTFRVIKLEDSKLALSFCKFGRCFAILSRNPRACEMFDLETRITLIQYEENKIIGTVFKYDFYDRFIHNSNNEQDVHGNGKVITVFGKLHVPLGAYVAFEVLDRNPRIGWTVMHVLKEKYLLSTCYGSVPKIVFEKAKQKVTMNLGFLSMFAHELLILFHKNPKIYTKGIGLTVIAQKKKYYYWNGKHFVYHGSSKYGGDLEVDDPNDIIEDEDRKIRNTLFKIPDGKFLFVVLE